MLASLAAGLNHYYVAQVDDTAAGTKITNTGTSSISSGYVFIEARPRRPPPSKVSTPPSRAGLFGYDRYHGELPGQSAGLRARPASVAPARMKTKKFETQAVGVDITFKCYGADVTTSGGNFLICDGP